MSRISRTLSVVCSAAVIAAVTVGVPAAPASATTTTVDCTTDGTTTGTFTITDNEVTDDSACTGDVIIPNWVTSIGTDAFRGSGLTSIVIPKSVTAIGTAAFSNAAGLTLVTFEPDSALHTIGQLAFNASALKSIVIPRSVKAIAKQAFTNANGLAMVTFEGDAPSFVGADAFRNVAPGAKANISHAAREFGTSGIWNNLIVVRAAAPLNGALTPEFGAPVRTADGFTVNVTNFDGEFTWVANAGGVLDGVLTVTGVDPGVEVTVTVTTLRDGYADGSATVTGAAREGAEAAPVDARTVLPSVTCSPLPAQVGSLVTCTVAGGVSGIDILWRVAFNPTVAGEGLTLDASGSGEFSFTVPVAALGQELTIELVDWAAPMSLGVPGGPVPTSVPSGEGPVTVWPLVLLLALAGGLVLRRGVCAQA